MCYDNCKYFNTYSECCTKPFNQPCLSELHDREEDEKDNMIEEDEED
jgi:hypothetical protein